VAARVGLLLALLCATAGAETRPPYGGRAVGSLLSAPASFDPLAARSHAEVTLALLLYDGLYRLDADGRPLPALAEGMPQLSADGLEARIALKQGVRFHDGRALAAADVAASLARAQGGWPLAAVASVTAGADGTVVVRLRRATPELATLLAAPQLGVTPQGAPPDRAPVGTGPFRVRKIDLAARRIELEAFADCFAGRPYLDALVLRWFEDPDDEARAYEAGEADFSLRGAVAFAGHEPKYPTASAESGAAVLTYLGFGRAHGALLDDPKVRSAISQAVGRGALRHVGAGERVVPSASPASPDFGGPAPAAADLAARPEAAAADPRLRGVSLEVLVDKSRPDDTDVATRVVSALDRAGIAATYRVLPPAQMQRLVAAGLCDLYIGQLAAAGPDPAWAYALAFAAGGERPRDAPTAEAFAARLPIVPLLHRAVRVHYKRTLRGVGPDALGRLRLADAFLWNGPADAVVPD
jgi:ABC-type transport system substrate-binding protein